MQTDPLSPSNFPGVVADLGYPSTHFGQLHVEGVEAWQRVLPHLTGPERMSVLRQHRRRLLLSTIEGRRKARGWLQSSAKHPAPAETRDERLGRLLDGLKFFGDPECLRPCVRALMLMPRCISDYILERCAVIVAGRSTRGWTSGPLPHELCPIVLDGNRPDDELARVFVHECAHSWLHVQPSARSLTTHHSASFAATLPRELVDTETRLGELQANVLTIALLPSGQDSMLAALGDWSIGPTWARPSSSVSRRP